MLTDESTAHSPLDIAMADLVVRLDTKDASSDQQPHVVLAFKILFEDFSPMGTKDTIVQKGWKVRHGSPSSLGLLD
jgi:hypothetical protein